MKAIIYGHEVLFDREDLFTLMEFPWQLRRSRENAGYYLKATRKLTSGTQMFCFHRMVFGPIQDGMLVDHINGNTLDNRKVNLRLCDRSQNAFNRGKAKNNTSGFKGVYLDRSKFRPRPWRAAFKARNKNINVGMFATAEEAYAAYCEAVKKYHGEFGRTE